MTVAAGRFVTVEGIEGVGKTTQVASLAGLLSQRGIAHLVTREPGGTILAEKIRDVVLSPGAEPMPPVAELLLMFAARSVHLVNRIEPALSSGLWVVCDRFTDATYAYQGAGRGTAEDDIRSLEILVQRGRRPDLTLLLDAPVEIGLRRSQQRDTGRARDRFEGEQRAFFERVRQGYLRRALAEPQRVAVIDAAAPAEEVAARIAAVLRSKSWIC